MACDTSTLSSPPSCLAYTSQRRQLIDLVFLLGAAVNEINAEFALNWSTIATAAAAVDVCVPTSVARAKAAEVVEDGLVIADLTALDCLSVGELEQIRLYLTCTLVDNINP